MEQHYSEGPLSGRQGPERRVETHGVHVGRQQSKGGLPLKALCHAGDADAEDPWTWQAPKAPPQMHSTRML